MKDLFIHRRNESNDSNVKCCRPIPSNVNLQKESPVCMPFTFEGHRDHYTHPQQRQPAEPVFLSLALEGHGDH
ncbi:hypothetical protein DAPPUDRAFT_314314 [Daphnia pulex]|uniref:Uncharacterized protein n=1 Tax=Daphnia pulex TaxID=6669 RepID=E9G6R0_DAPPU|nr:hypothetical protein DAPPUDRAFT_314314 [Daphnia pulex]|eukprot:EFX85148.1 hypothetical protein DAPPUDRAFT_314314 [Daphnia pulex]